MVEQSHVLSGVSLETQNLVYGSKEKHVEQKQFQYSSEAKLQTEKKGANKTKINMGDLKKRFTEVNSKSKQQTRINESDSGKLNRADFDKAA